MPIIFVLRLTPLICVYLLHSSVFPLATKNEPNYKLMHNMSDSDYQDLALNKCVLYLVFTPLKKDASNVSCNHVRGQSIFDVT